MMDCAIYVEPFLLFITKRSTFKDLELTQKPLKWNIERVNLDIRACYKMLWGQLISIHTVS